MGDIKFPDEALKAAVEIVKEPTGNILSEPTKEIGEGIASFVNLVFSPFRYGKQKASIYFAHKLEVYKKELVEKEKSIPEDKRAEPDFHTVSLALENSKFCITDDDIRHMFVNLIGSALNSDTKNAVHPAYAEILKQMNSTDALVFKSFATDNPQPILEIRKLNPNGSSFKCLYSNLYLQEDIKSVEQLTASITNLSRLGLVKISYEYYITDKELYTKLNEVARSMTEQLNIEEEELQYCKGSVTLTALGLILIKLCVSPI